MLNCRPFHLSVSVVQCEEPEAALQDCFEDTRWEPFGQVETVRNTSTVMDYISFCVEKITKTKAISFPQNQKPWLNTTVSHPGESHKQSPIGWQRGL